MNTYNDPNFVGTLEGGGIVEYVWRCASCQLNVVTTDKDVRTHRVCPTDPDFLRKSREAWA